MVRRYELLVIFDGALPEEIVSKEQEQIEDLLKKNFGYVSTDVWGKRTLAYKLNKRDVGYYCLFIFDGENDVNEKIAKALKLNQKVLRSMVVLHEEVKEVAVEELSGQAEIEEGDE